MTPNDDHDRAVDDLLGAVDGALNGP